MMQTTTYDMIIVGGGMVGSALACALARYTPLSIAILETQTSNRTWFSGAYHHRVSAVALSSVRFLQKIDVWDDIKQHRISSFKKIQVWDKAGKSEMTFDSKDINEAELGYIVENNLIQESLIRKIKQYPQIHFISPVQAQHITLNQEKIVITTQEELVLSAKLAVAADGARSWLREQANITIEKHDYGQEAIVATVKTSLPHQGVASQCFLGTGPLAFLPLAEPHLSSIVWSLPANEAKRIVGLVDETFNSELTQAFSSRLGEVKVIGKRFTFALGRHQAKQYVKSKVVLVGDAAHTVHPLAGQGVNMGFLDAAALAEIIIDALQRQRDWASEACLRRYERWRKADNMTMLLGVDVVKNLFSTQNTSLQKFCTLGMDITQDFAWLKNYFIRQAVGNRGGIPRLASK